jgi:hypothetical protein
MEIQVGDIVNVTIDRATLDRQEVKTIPGNNQVYWELQDTVTGVVTVVGPALTTMTKVP